MKIKKLSFGSINIDGENYFKDIVIHKGKIKKRKKKESKKFRGRFGHTPLSILENIPWDCKKLIIGTGHSYALPVMNEVKEKAKKKGVELVLKSTPDAILYINEKNTNLILHLAC
ncbi:hypothetical protein DRH13_03490 [Candidatus Woesebacteria bacterium]|jgi:hypothetical protein|nr:MAG: hypothetical protein DRH13_03490 [Candidatus Woesebacteria bacterium]